MSSLIRDWPHGREPLPPPEFDPWRELSAAPEELPEALVRAGLETLDRAVARPGRDRGAAFLLLEADGYLTYACEAAATTPRAEEALTEILERVGGRSP